MKTKLLKSSMILSGILTLNLAHAATTVAVKDKAKEKEDTRPPIGCRDSGYQFVLEALHLKPGSNGDNQSLYVMYNQLNQAVTLYQMHGEESTRSAYLNHVIGPHEWAVLSTGEKQVKFICSVPEKKSLYGQVVDCATSLKVCEYTNARYGLNNRGNFWLYNSSTKGGAASAVVHYGIIPGN